MTYADWVAAAASAKPHARLERGDARLFENAVMVERALWPLWQLRDRNLHETENCCTDSRSCARAVTQTATLISPSPA